MVIISQNSGFSTRILRDPLTENRDGSVPNRNIFVPRNPEGPLGQDWRKVLHDTRLPRDYPWSLDSPRRGVTVVGVVSGVRSLRDPLLVVSTTLRYSSTKGLRGPCLSVLMTCLWQLWTGPFNSSLNVVDVFVHVLFSGLFLFCLLRL